MKRSFPILEVRNLKLEREGVLYLDIPWLSIEKGEVLSLIGPNGAGKTTLLQTLSFLGPPFQGEIFFRGDRVGLNLSILQYRRRLAMVFQEPLLFDTTVLNNVASGLKIHGIKKDEIRARAMKELERFGIFHLRGRSAKTLSAGEAQRTSLARAFALRPEILFLDEPFASLDSPTRESLLRDLDSILRESGTTAVFATHDRMEALTLSDRIAVIKDGRMLQIGTPEEVANHPADEFVASFVGAETILSGRVLRKDGGTIVASVEGAEIEAIGDADAGEAVLLYIRPENVILSTQPHLEATSARNVFRGKVVKIVSLGPYQKIQLDCSFPLIAYITQRSREALSLKEGREVRASFKATAVTVIRKGWAEGLSKEEGQKVP